MVLHLVSNPESRSRSHTYVKLRLGPSFQVNISQNGMTCIEDLY